MRTLHTHTLSNAYRAHTHASTHSLTHKQMIQTQMINPQSSSTHATAAADTVNILRAHIEKQKGSRNKAQPTLEAEAGWV